MTTFSSKKLHMEHFTGTTDGSGDLTVSLSSTPANTATQFVVYSNTANVVPKVQSITGASLVVRFYKFQYDKMSSTATDADNVPSGVSATGTKQNTTAGGTADIVYYVDNVSQQAHIHAVPFQYVHSHNISTFTATDMTVAMANSLPVELLILYAVT